MTFVFAVRPEESPRERIARCAEEALARGPMGDRARGEDYEAFLDGVWGNGRQLRHVRTSCAVFAGAILGYCGHALRKPWHADGTWGITSWLNLSTRSPSWVPASTGQDPEAGDVCYWGSLTGSNGHVGVVVERLPSGLYRTAEGGGGPDGTMCRLSSPDGKDIRHSAGRSRAGFWSADLMGLPTYEQLCQRLIDANADTEPPNG